MGKHQPNQMNCSTCDFAKYGEKTFCAAPVPLFVPTDVSRVVTNPQERCDAHKAAKGTFKRICLNCGNPIRTHHKYSNLGQDQWIHKYCDHPDSPSKYHYETYAKGKHANA